MRITKAVLQQQLAESQRKETIFSEALTKIVQSDKASSLELRQMAHQAKLASGATPMYEDANVPPNTIVRIPFNLMNDELPKWYL